MAGENDVVLRMVMICDELLFYDGYWLFSQLVR